MNPLDRVKKMEQGAAPPAMKPPTGRGRHPMTVMPASRRPPLPGSSSSSSSSCGPSGVPSSLFGGSDAAASPEVLVRGWQDYFRERMVVELPERNLRSCVFLAGPDLREQGETQESSDPPCVLLLLHGGGHTSMSWALVASSLAKEHDIPVLAMDFRAHGETELLDAEGGEPGGEEDLTADTLVRDVGATLQGVLHEVGCPTVRLVLAGHSLGGAIAVRAAHAISSGMFEEGLPVDMLCGLVVLDVVEGTAVTALPHMNQVLASRPGAFPTLKRAINWALRTNEVRNKESASVSIPSQLREDPSSGRFSWRTDLLKTEAHWKGWFSGLSSLFLGTPCPKLLILAGTDRLDRELTIAQMQGKFQMNVVYGAGHVLQEDCPDKACDVLRTFLTHHLLLPDREVPPAVANSIDKQ